MGSGKLPNILFLLSDDQGAWAMHCAGNPELITPSLDRLAEEGVRFENFFCVSPVCSPARASLLTGRIPSEHGVHDWILKGNIHDPGDQYGYRGKDRPVEYLAGISGFTEYLAKAGYRCGLSGKWHLGDSANPQKGFQDWYVHGFGGGNYRNYQVFEDGQIKTKTTYVTDEFTDHALDLLEQYAQTPEQPFFLAVHYTAPHSPWDRSEHLPEDWALYDGCRFHSLPDLPPHPWGSACRPDDPEKRREHLQGYFTAITAMDRNIGRLMAKLEELHLREDTIVVFTADNGMSMGQHGIWGKGNGTYPLNMYDTAVKVPFLISCPGLPGGRVDGELRSHYDWFPTVLDYLGIENPEAEALPGRSFAPLLRGEDAAGCSHVVVFDEYGPVRMIRSRRWKYVHRYPAGPHELYDLEQDPGEEVNRVDDPDCAATVEEMRGQLREWFLRYTDPARDGVYENVTGNGQLGLCGAASGGLEAFLPWEEAAAKRAMRRFDAENEE